MTDFPQFSPNFAERQKEKLNICHAIYVEDGETHKSWKLHFVRSDKSGGSSDYIIFAKIVCDHPSMSEMWIFF